MLDIHPPITLFSGTECIPWEFMRFVWNSHGINYALSCNLKKWSF